MQESNHRPSLVGDVAHEGSAVLEIPSKQQNSPRRPMFDGNLVCRLWEIPILNIIT